MSSPSTRVNRVASDFARLRLSSDGADQRDAPSIAPINLIPSELLSEVLLYAASRDMPQCHAQGELAPEISLSHVCQHWRTVASGTPALWSHIAVSLVGCEASVDHLELYLARAKSTQLKIDVDFRINHPSHQRLFMQIVEPIMQALVSRIEYWHDVGFILGHGRQLAEVIHYLGNSFEAPRLVRFDLVLEEPERIPPAWRLACKTPKLRTTMLENIPLDWSSAVASFFHNLEDVNITFAEGCAPSLAQFQSMIHRCRNLRTLHLVSFDSPADEFADHDPSDVIVLPYLTVLVLGDIPPKTLAQMLEIFHFPALQQLNLTMETPDPTGTSFNPVVRLLTTRRFQLQNLSITGVDCGIPELRALLVNLPTLTGLYMVLDEAHEETCDSLSPAPHGAMPVPKLETLTLRTAHVSRHWEPFSVLRRALQNRVDLGVRLKKLVVDNFAHRAVDYMKLGPPLVLQIEYRNLEQRRLSDRSPSVLSEDVSASTSEVDE